MKRILSTILLCVTVLCAYSQEDVTLFFLNDGTFKGFYDEEIDSITYSHLDLDSIWHTDAVVQEVWLADSVVRIPVEKIDSICHKVPESEYMPETIILDDGYLPYISSVDGLTITFSSNLPEHLRPHEGSILYFNGISELFPEGFAGKVVSMNGGVITCEQAGITDIYQKFVFFGKYTVVKKDQADAPSYALRRIKGRKENAHDRQAVSKANTKEGDDDFGIGEGKFPDFNIGSFKEAFEFELKDYNVKIKTSFKETPVFTIEYAYAFNFYNPILFYKCKKTVDYENSYSIAYAPDYNLLKDDNFWKKYGDIPKFQKLGDYQLTRDEKDRGTVYFIDKKYPLPDCPLIQVGAKVGFFITPKVEGELVLGATNKGTYEKTYIYKLDKDHWLNLSDDWKDYLLPWKYYTGQFLKMGEGQCFDGPQTHEPTEWYLDGSAKASIWAGFVAGASISAGFGENAEVKEEAKFRIGPYLEGEIKLSMLDGLSDWSRYSLVKDTHVKVGVKLGFDLSFSAKLKSKFLGCDVGFQWDQIDWSPKNLLWERTWYLLPEYEAPKYTIRGNSLICTANVSRMTFPNTIGFALFDEKGNVKRKYMTDTYKNYHSDNPFYMSLTFDGLDFANHRYTIVPTSNLFTTDLLKFDAPDQYRTTVLCPDSHHPHLIDLGLPSGTKWLCSNLYADDPKDAGGYYQWGKPFMVHAYTDITYRAPNFTMANYQSSEYDAATANLGQEYCTPTMSQFLELHDNCRMEYKYSPLGDKVLGAFFRGKNGNNLYLPFSGFKSGVKVNNSSEGWFLSSDAMDSNNNPQRKAAVFKNNDVLLFSFDALAYGHSVRPVSAGSDGLVFEPQQLDFEVYVGQEVGQYVTIANNGSTPVNITVAQTIAPFRVDDASLGTFTVKPKERLSVLVYFSPTEKIEYTSVLTLSYETGNACVVSKVPLKGKGIDPAAGNSILVMQEAIKFGEVEVGGSERRYLTIVNNGTESEDVNLKIEDPYLLSNYGGEYGGGGRWLRNLSFTMAPNSQEMVVIHFDPTTVGRFNSEITMTSNGIAGGKMVIPVYASVIVAQEDPSFHLSTNSIDIYVNDDDIVEILNGSGEYDLINNYPDIVETDINVPHDAHMPPKRTPSEEEMDMGDLWWIQGKKVGHAILKVKDKKTNEVLTLNVEVKRAPSLSLSAHSVEVGVGESDSSIEIQAGSGWYDISSNDPEIATARKTYKSVSWVDENGVAHEGNFVEIQGLKVGDAKVTVKDNSSGETAVIYVKVKGEEQVSYLTCPDDHHPHLIDLGLPSGTKWACCNVDDDHTKQSPTNYGSYYAWGETKEHEDLIYNWSTYTHCDGSSSTCHDLGSDIAGTQYDVAYGKWGGSWVMPSKEQQDELRNNCTYEWTTVNGVKGGKFTSKTNGGSIFLPAAGYRRGSYLDNAGSRGYYWSSTQYPSYAGGAYILYFNSGGTDWDYYDRLDGRSVRPVVRN